MSKIGLLVPSRGRPENIKRLLESLLETSTTPTNVELHVGVDSDDPSLDGYHSNWLDTEVGDVSYVLHIRSGLRLAVSWINYLASVNVDTCSILGTVGDDNVFQTRGWDERVITSLEAQKAGHGFGMCFGNDLHPGRAPGTLACHVFFTSSVVKALGYFVHPGLQHLYCDDVWTQLGRLSTLEWLDDVLIPHLHPTATITVKNDETYEAAAATNGADREAYQLYMNSETGFRKDLEKLKGLKP